MKSKQISNSFNKIEDAVNNLSIVGGNLKQFESLNDQKTLDTLRQATIQIKELIKDVRAINLRLSR